MQKQANYLLKFSITLCVELAGIQRLQFIINFEYILPNPNVVKKRNCSVKVEDAKNGRAVFGDISNFILGPI